MEFNPPIVLPHSATNWDEWLEQTEAKLNELGYRKYNQNHHREDFAYWKAFSREDQKMYQIGLLFYDFRKYKHTDPGANRIGIQFECMLIDIDCRVDLSVSDDKTLEEFERMSADFYNTMIKYVNHV